MVKNKDTNADFAKSVDDVLVYLACASRHNDRNICGLFEHDGALLWTDSFCTQSMRERQNLGLPSLVSSREIPNHFDVSMLFDGTEGDKFELVRVTPLSFTERVRLARIGLLAKVTKRVMAVKKTHVSTVGEFFIRKQFFEETAGGFNWRPMNEGSIVGKRKRVITGSGENFREYEVASAGHNDSGTGVSFGLIAAWSLPRVWQVHLSLPESPSIVFTTDCIGAREVFRLRDIPDGRSRRDVLLHWVREHWRQNRHDPEEEVKVRQHLRGHSEFDWYGLHCRLKASDTDVQRNEQLRQERRADDHARRVRS